MVATLPDPHDPDQLQDIAWQGGAWTRWTPAELATDAETPTAMRADDDVPADIHAGCVHCDRAIRFDAGYQCWVDCESDGDVCRATGTDHQPEPGSEFLPD